MVYKIDWSISWYVPAQLGAGIPTPEELGRLLPKEVPQHTAIKVGAIGLDGFKHLSFISKGKCVSDVSTVVNKPRPLALAVLIHQTILAQLMAQVCRLLYPWKVPSIEL